MSSQGAAEHICKSNGLGAKSTRQNISQIIGRRRGCLGKLNCICFNARSVTNKLAELELLLKCEKPDLVGITETWANSGISDGELSFEGYTLFRRDREEGNKKGGVG